MRAVATLRVTALRTVAALWTASALRAVATLRTTSLRATALRAVVALRVTTLRVTTFAPMSTATVVPMTVMTVVARVVVVARPSPIVRAVVTGAAEAFPITMAAMASMAASPDRASVATASSLFGAAMPVFEKPLKQRHKMLALLITQGREQSLVRFGSLSHRDARLFLSRLGEPHDDGAAVGLACLARHKPRGLHLAKQFAQRSRSHVKLLGDDALAHLITVRGEYAKHSVAPAVGSLAVHEQVRCVAEHARQTLASRYVARRSPETARVTSVARPLLRPEAFATVPAPAFSVGAMSRPALVRRTTPTFRRACARRPLRLDMTSAPALQIVSRTMDVAARAVIDALLLLAKRFFFRTALDVLGVLG